MNTIAQNDALTMAVWTDLASKLNKTQGAIRNHFKRLSDSPNALNAVSQGPRKRYSRKWTRLDEETIKRAAKSDSRHGLATRITLLAKKLGRSNHAVYLKYRELINRAKDQAADIDLSFNLHRLRKWTEEDDKTIIATAETLLAKELPLSWGALASILDRSQHSVYLRYKRITRATEPHSSSDCIDYYNAASIVDLPTVASSATLNSDWSMDVNVPDLSEIQDGYDDAMLADALDALCESDVGSVVQDPDCMHEDFAAQDYAEMLDFDDL
jgi:hypothetical protein